MGIWENPSLITPERDSEREGECVKFREKNKNTTRRRKNLRVRYPTHSPFPPPRYTPTLTGTHTSHTPTKPGKKGGGVIWRTHRLLSQLSSLCLS